MDPGQNIEVQQKSNKCQKVKNLVHAQAPCARTSLVHAHEPCTTRVLCMHWNEKATTNLMKGRQTPEPRAQISNATIRFVSFRFVTNDSDPIRFERFDMVSRYDSIRFLGVCVV
jgi:hypothetical protein